MTIKFLNWLQIELLKIMEHLISNKIFSTVVFLLTMLVGRYFHQATLQSTKLSKVLVLSSKTSKFLFQMFNGNAIPGAKEPLLVKFADGGNKKKALYNKQSDNNGRVWRDNNDSITQVRTYMFYLDVKHLLARLCSKTDSYASNGITLLCRHASSTRPHSTPLCDRVRILHAWLLFVFVVYCIDYFYLFYSIFLY